MASVDINDVRKAFGLAYVIHGVNIAIDDGEFVVLVGPSGCGKSTLLRMLAGLENITDGEIKIGDRVVNHLPPKERDVAMVFQNYALYPHMTVAANMAFSMKLRGAPKDETERRVKRAAEILGLQNLLERFPRQLSGGQRQRVAMGRAIVRDPQVFLFDEPLSNLDAKLRVQMRTEIKELHQRLKTTTVYVTHDQIEAMTMADKIVVMHDGRVEQIGAPLELYDRPQNHLCCRLYRLAGDEFSARRHSEQWQPRIRSDPAARACRSPGAPAGSDGRPAIYGVRPEHFTIADDGAEATDPVSSNRPARKSRSSPNSAAPKLSRCSANVIQFKPGDKIRLKPDPAARASVRRRIGRTAQANNQTGRNDHDDIRPPHAAQGRHGAATAAAPDRACLSRVGQSLGARRRPGSRRKTRSFRCCAGNISCKSEDDQFVKLIDAFTKATGVKVTIWPRVLRGRAAESLGRRQYRRRARTCSGACTRCRICSRKNASMSPTSPTISARNMAAGSTVRAEIRQGTATSGSASRSAIPATCMNYRHGASNKAGFSKFPSKTDEFLEYAKAMKKNNTPGGFALGHASGDGNAWVYWCLWAHGGNIVDKNDKVTINSPETEKALNYAKAALREHDPWHRRMERRLQQQGVPRRRNQLDRQRHLDLRRRQEGCRPRTDIAKDMDHASCRSGPVGKPTELHLMYPILAMTLHEISAGLQSADGLHAGGGPVQSVDGGGAGLSHPLPQRLRQEPDLDRRSEETRFSATSAKRTLTAGGLGSVGEKAAAAIADFVVLDMFASYCTGREDAKASIKIAERQLQRIYRCDDDSHVRGVMPWPCAGHARGESRQRVVL